MENPRTIILAVVSAKNDAANQIILDLFKKIDKNGSRTLGIITKPDCISAGDERFWLDLASNKEIFLERGWHVLRNRADHESSMSFTERNAAEEMFFEQGLFKDLPPSSVGIDALRERLSTLLHRHLVQELPSLREEMKSKLQSTCKTLEGLGQKRETTYDQRVLLMRFAQEINQILCNAIDGHYSHEFFEAVSLEDDITVGTNIRRFRALIQTLNTSFAKDMRQCGHKFGLKSRTTSTESDDEHFLSHGSDVDPDYTVPSPKQITEEQRIEWVKKMMVRCRGRELPGSVNSEVTSHLFWEQSEPWKTIAEHHVESVHFVSKQFIVQVLEHVTPEEFQKPLQQMVVNEVLEHAFKDGRNELDKLLRDKNRHPRSVFHKVWLPAI